MQKIMALISLFHLASGKGARLNMDVTFLSTLPYLQPDMHLDAPLNAFHPHSSPANYLSITGLEPRKHQPVALAASHT